MKSEILSQEKNVIVIKVEYDPQEVSAEIAKTVKELSAKTQFKGFRKGHIPRRTLELYVGKQNIAKETIDRLMPEALSKVVEDYDLDVLLEPRAKVGVLLEGQPFDVELTIEVRPEVTLPELSTITAVKEIYPVTEKQVEEAAKQVLEMSAEYKAVEEDRPVGSDDTINIEYRSDVVEADGSLKPLEKDARSTVDLKQTDLRPAIRDALIGKKPAEIATADIVVEEDHRDKNIAGKTVRYALEVLEILNRVVPELNDETAAKLSDNQASDVESFKKLLREKLEASATERSKDSLRADAVRKVSEAATVDVPDSLVTLQKARLRAEQDRRMQSELSLSLEDYLKKDGVDKEAFEKDLERRSYDMARRTLVLEELAEKNDIQVLPEDITTEIAQMSVQMRVDAKKLAEYIYGDRSRIMDIAARLRMQKTQDYVAEHVAVEEKEVDFDALPEQGEAPVEPKGSEEASENNE